MADLISREAAIELFACKENEFHEKFRPSIRPVFAQSIARVLAKLPAVDAVEIASCDGCIYAHGKRPQKCSCCRRNKEMKDCYRREEND